MADYPDDESELSGPRVEHHHHYSQNKNGNGADSSKVNTILLLALMAIIGFVGASVWGMNERLARVETNVTTLLARP
jgi:hypothetical protein